MASYADTEEKKNFLLPKLILHALVHAHQVRTPSDLGRNYFAIGYDEGARIHRCAAVASFVVVMVVEVMVMVVLRLDIEISAKCNLTQLSWCHS